MEIYHIPEDRIIELPEQAFDTWDPPSSMQEMLPEFGIDLGFPVTVVNVQYVEGRWVVEYA